ncbi:phospholipase D-like domain-containing protein [Paraburkholderia humisilvae]|uniref:phospholipase D n=1 Tax=Paraburkholderia humisilvae TaxID=627669 RepID=A0A6J5DKR5_9BURK|nr:phospholipase D-like domain-containing protein [Paraburkholderia humisilvae]CAB3754563.1 hypothetical protein LMG29542_02384 [Paraburkholderia humisilvae]
MKKMFALLVAATVPIFAHAGLIDSTLEDLGVWRSSGSSSQSDVSTRGLSGNHEFKKPSRERGGLRKTSYGNDSYNSGNQDAAARNAPHHGAVMYQAVGTIELGFSPNRGAMDVVIDVINSSTRTLDVAAYEFTNKRYENAVIAAVRRGVDVRIVVDAKENLNNPKSIAGPLAQAGAKVRYVDDAPLMHDKYTIADRDTVETGSLNYTLRAEKYSHENARADWHNKPIAGYYESDFEYMWENAHPWR